ncbi:MAG: hypothetical protein KGL51_00465 [Betaproteobacteria bacterium]|nr:hypothetical protein [Betaproteobacteria bacterium]MDE2123590.1 hypothetical protein [Betaproteobacteria bacterium]MDE2186142.1 hypothetical protein [Betaproteobacteria bacterium]MDE2323139.1 hypothetical protein [Betaproteobacteria bacterium]
MSRSLETRLQRLERIAAKPRCSPERVAQAREKLMGLLERTGPHEVLARLEQRATTGPALRFRDFLRDMLGVSHAQP